MRGHFILYAGTHSDSDPNAIAIAAELSLHAPRTDHLVALDQPFAGAHSGGPE